MVHRFLHFTGLKPISCKIGKILKLNIIFLKQRWYVFFSFVSGCQNAVRSYVRQLELLITTFKSDIIRFSRFSGHATAENKDIFLALKLCTIYVDIFLLCLFRFFFC